MDTARLINKNKGVTMDKAGDRLVTLANQIALEELAKVRDIKARDLRLAIWLAKEQEIK